MTETKGTSGPEHHSGFFGWLFSWKGARAGFILLASLATLWGLFCAIENWRGQRAWVQTRLELASKGEKLEFKELLGPPIPDDQNLAMIPLFKPLMDWTSQPMQRPRDSNAFNRVSSIGMPKGSAKLGGWLSGQRIDLESWADSFRSDTNFPSRPQATTPAEDILHGLTRYEAEFSQLLIAAKLPYARFPIHYEDGVNALLPHLAALKSFSSLLSFRAGVLLQKGRAAEAYDDIRAALRLGEAVGEDGPIISILVHLAIDQICFQPVWEGITDHRWNEDQLKELQRLFGSSQYLKEMRQALRLERVMIVNHTLDQFIENARDLPRLLDVAGSGDLAGGGANLANLLPRGWIRQNQAALNRLYQRLLDGTPEDGLELHKVDLAALRSAIDTELLSGFMPYKIMARMLFPSVSQLFSKTLKAHALAAVAGAGCALERHRIAHGSYPETLAGLDRKFVVTPLIDPCTGSELKYLKREDGTRLVYSVGLNRKDENGTFDAKREGRQSPVEETGDLPLILPAK